MTDYTAIIGGYNFGGIFQSTTTVLWWSMTAVIIGVIVWFIWYIFSFRHTVIIKEKFGQAITVNVSEANRIEKLDKGAFKSLKASGPFKSIKETAEVSQEIDANTGEKVLKIYPYIGKIHRAKFKTRKKIQYLQLMFTGIKLMVPDNVFINITKRGKKFIELTKLSHKLYAPTVLIDNDTGQHEYLFNEGWFDWVVNDIERDHQKYLTQNWWDKYGNWVLTLGLLMLMLIIIVVTLRHTQQIVGAAGSIAESVGEAARLLADAQTNQNIG